MLRLILSVLIASLAYNPAWGAECTYQAALDQAMMKSIERSAQTAESTMPLLDEMIEIGSKATIPNKSVGEQLSSQDAARMAKLTQRISALQLGSFVESNRERDLRVVSKMIHTAEQLYLGKPANVVIRKDDIPGNVLMLMRMILPETKLTIPEDRKPTGCTLDEALIRLELEGLQRFSAYNQITENVLRDLNTLVQRYGKPLDPSKFTQDDRKWHEQLTVRIAPARRERSFLHDLENIRSWWEAADLVYRTRKEDMVTYGSEMSALGRTLKGMEAQLSERQMAMNGLWHRVNEKMPSQFMNDLSLSQPKQ